MAAQPIQSCAEGSFLLIHVQPGAAQTEYAGLHGEALKIRIAAPPVKGAANEELRRFLAKQFDLPKSAVHVESGASARRKLVLLKGVPVQRVHEILERSGAEG